MSHSQTREAAFESVLEDHLLDHGYQVVSSSDFDQDAALFPSEALTFIQETQPDTWAKLENLLGERTGEQVITDLTKWLDDHGCLSTLRHGFKCYGRRLHVAYFRPVHGMNPNLQARYEANRLGITRQVHYDPEHPQRSIDTVLSVNGVPVATVELKNPMTGSDVNDAIEQYEERRNPQAPLLRFKKRALVHFAVDPDEVHMTTRLAKGSTTFLPFNKGISLEGERSRKAGNPPNPDGGYKTAYLWEEVLERDSFLDLLARYLHVHTETKHTEDGRQIEKEKLIFPRYHQLRTVRKLTRMARAEGVGHNYLVEHSTGSGKSITISWLAHRLSSLHDAEDEPVFDTVVVVTDRTVLDKQLQDQIYQFEHRQGVVQKIDVDSQQLARALDSGVPIVITTLQKFPFVTEHLQEMAKERGADDPEGVLPTRNCAVIIDEAHSSQHGDFAKELKGVLGGEELREKAEERAEQEGLDDEEALYREMAKRSQQENISFFAFTGTPKHKTLAVFGRDGKPVDSYSMRQAIEEGFIMNVLDNYTTYDTYFQLLDDSEDDPEVERKKAVRELSKFMRLHPHNIAQKTEVMVEHFQSVTRHKIGGKAKAMVVTSSRLEAVRYKQQFDKYITENDYDLDALVAFSGTVQDDKVENKTYTEQEMNDGISDKELPQKFSTSEYQLLLVAEKYQTGFDEPLLHTMYVDRRLSGLQAVQTLSRLNRTHPLKEDTFVLDFVNDREEIRRSFSKFYDGVEMGEEPDPSRMYQLQAELDASGIYHQEELDRFCKIYFKSKRRQSASDHEKMNAALDPAVERFVELREENEEEAEEWRSKVGAFRNLYSYLSQIIPYQDSDLERLYTFLRHLSNKLPRRSTGQDYQFDDDVRLEYYRLQKISEGSIDLGEPDEKPKADGPTETGTSKVREDSVALSRLIDQINERFGTDFTESDQLFFDQLVEEAASYDSLQQAAQTNPRKKFALIFEDVLERLIVERMDQNEEIFARWIQDDDFRQVVDSWLTDQIYRRLSD